MAIVQSIGKGRDKRYTVIYKINTPDGAYARKAKMFPPGTPKAAVEKFAHEMAQQYVPVNKNRTSTP